MPRQTGRYGVGAGRAVSTPTRYELHHVAQEAVTRGAIQKPSELAGLLAALPMPMTRVLEIGSKDGGTLWLWRQFAAEVVSIDLAPVALNLDGVRLIQGDSHNVTIAGGFDFVFIDGDHTYEGARQDFEDFSGHTTLVGLHDIVPGDDGRGVDRLWAELKAEYRTEEWIDERDVAVRGEVLTARDGGIGLVHLCD